MRLRLRAAGFFALAIIAITCTDAPTSPRDGHGAMSARHLSMSPSFSPSAAQVYRNLAAFGIEVTQVHVHLTGPDGSIRDTTIAFPVGQDTLTIDIPVDGGGTDQTYTALLELRNDAGDVLFSGTQSIVARTGNLTTEPPPSVVLKYVRPDARTKTVTVAPGDTTVGASATIATKATAIDSSGVAVTDLLVFWSTSDATLATVTTNGNTTASVVGQGRRGTATISASTATGIVGTSKFTFVPPPAKIVVVSGGGQTGVAGSLLAAPLVVEVQASDNLPVPGAPVTFSAVSAGGAVTTATATSDALGRASTTLTLGKTGGAYQYQAASGVLPAVSVSETATPAPPAAIAIASGDAQTDSVGRTLGAPLVVKVTDQFGGAASGATVTWARVTGSGTVGAATSTTGSDGLASTTYTLGNTVGGETVSATVTGVSGAAGTTTFNATAISRGAAAIALVSGGGQSGAPGVTLGTPLVVRVADALNNPVANASVAWTTPSAGTTFTPASALTDALGQVSTTVKLGTTAGPVVASATTASLVATANLTIVAGPAAVIAKVAGDAQTAEVATNVAVAPSAKVTDASGNAVAGAAVVFSVASGGGSVTAATASTDASGVAAVGSWKLGNTVGANTLTATAGALSTTFTATAKSGSAAKLAFVAAPPASITVGAPVPPISGRIVDALGNPVASAGVTITATAVVTPSGETTNFTATTDATGLATFTPPPYVGPLGTIVLTLASPGLTSVASSPFSATVGAPAKLAMKTQPSNTASSGAAFSVQPVLQLTDAGDNTTAVSGTTVTASIGSGGGTLNGTLTATSAADGTVSFTNLSITGTTGSRTLAFSATGLTGATSGTITLGAGAASAMTKNAGDAQTAAAGSAVAIAPSVLVKDAAGNPVAGVSVTFAAASGGGSVTGPTTTTNALGIATVGSWTLGNTVGANTLTASSGTLTATFSATSVAGAGTKLAFVVGVPAAAASGVALSTAPQVQLEDALGNPVTTSGIAITASFASGSGTLANASATTTAGGVATFSGLTISGTAGSYVLLFNAGGAYAPLSSGTIDLTAGSLATITISPTSTTVAAGQTTTFTATGRDATNNIVAVTPVWAVQTPASGSITSSGVFTAGSAVGTYTDDITATVGGVVGKASVTVTPGAIASITVSPAGASVTVGGSQTFTATAKDAFGNAVTFTPAWDVVAGGGTINAASGVFTAGTTAGTFANTVRASSGGVSGTAGVTISSGALASITVSPASPSLSPGGSVTFLATGADAFGNPKTIAPVWSVVGSAGSIGASSGVFTATTTAGSYPNSVIATSGAVTGSTGVTVVAGAAAKYVIDTPLPTSVTVGAAISPSSLTLHLADGSNNRVAQSGVAVRLTGTVSPSGATFSVAGTTDATGSASFTFPVYSNAVGTLSLTASSTSPVVSTLIGSGIPVNAGTPSTLSLARAPSSTASDRVPLATQPQVQLLDVGGNPSPTAGVVIAASVVSGGATVTGGSATTNASGLATFTTLALQGPVGPQVVQFASGTFAPVNAPSIALGAGAASSLTISAGNGQSATVNTAVAIPPKVIVKDGSGNPVAGATVAFNVASGGGVVTPASVVSDASGFAAVTSWTLGSTAGANTLTASATGVTPVTFTATGKSGAAAKLAFVAAPPASITVGAPIPTVTVQVLDALNNPVADAGAAVVVTGVTTPGGYSTTASVNTDASGLATFTMPPYTGPTGSIVLTFTSSGLTSVASSPITANAGAPAKLAITTQPSSTAASGAPFGVQPVLQVTDVGGNAVGGASVSVTATIASGGGSLGGTATVSSNASGVATFTNLNISGAAGAHTLAFSAAGLAGATSNTITLSAGAAAVMSKNGGDAQTATAGSTVPVPPSVLVTDAAGNPVAGAAVTFTVVGAGGVTGSPATTNASGIATVGSWTLGGTAGANSLQATSGALSVTFSATGTAGVASKLAFSVAPPSSITSGTALSPAVKVQVQDAFGNSVALSGASVSASVVAGTATLSGNTVTTDASGLATFPALTVTGTAGSVQLRFTEGSLVLNSSTLTLTAGAASKLAIKVAGSSSATNGSPLAVAPVIKIVDASGNAVAQAGTTITASVLTGTGSLSNASAVTDGTGAATFTGLTIAGTAGTFTLRYSSALLTSVDGGSITVTAGAASAMTKSAGDGQSATVGTAVTTAPRVLVTDASGNPVAGVAVTFAIASGGGSLTAPNATTDASGFAAVGQWTLGNTAGANSLTASASGLTTLTFTATGTAGAGTALGIATQPSASATNGVALGVQPVIQLQDAKGNAVSVAGVTVTASISSGSGSLAGASAVSDAAGKATFTGLAITGTAGSFVLNFDAPSYSTVASNTITLAAGSATTLAVTTGFSDGQSGVPFSTQPVVRLLDSGGNPVPASGVSVTVAIASGGGTLGGTTTQVTTASGVATFTDLMVTGTAGPRTFTFSGPGLASITTGPVNIAAGAIAKLSISTAPPATAQNDVAFTPQPVIQLLDASNNPVATAGVTITTTLDVGGSLKNSTATTDAGGAATFSGLAIQGVVGSYKITFGAAGATGVQTGAIALTAGLPAKMAFLQQPTNTTQNVAIAPPVTVQLQDDMSNPVTAGSYTATVALIPVGDASLSGTLTVPFTSGIATFSDLKVNLPSSSVQLVASTNAPGVSNVNSTSFAITAAGRAAITAETGIHVAVRPAEAIPSGKINFLVHDASLTPVSGVVVNFTNSNSDECNFSTLSATTDATGHATLGVNVNRLGGGCIVNAKAVGYDTAYVQIASVPLGATHAWIGGDVSGPYSYEVKENWLNMSTRTPQLPSSSDVAYVPAWANYTYPQLAFDHSVGGVVMDSSAYVDLGGKTLTTSADINAARGWLFNGFVVATGSGVNISGLFDALTLGRGGSCGVAAPEYANLRYVVASTSLTVACGATADTAQAPALTSLAGSFVKVNDNGTLIGSGSAAFNGDSLVIGANAGVAVYGGAAFAGRLGIVSGSSIFVTGAAEFSGYGDNAGGGIDIQGDVTFSGSGRTGYTFTGGGMNLYGNFTQKGSGSAFNATPLHSTYFAGTTPQTISMETPTSNGFGELDLQNDGGGVTMLSNLIFSNYGTDYTPRLYVYWSPLTVPASDTLTLSGYLYLNGGGTMVLNGAATYFGCSSDGSTYPVSGSGTANGAPVSAGGACSYGGSYARGLSANTRSSARIVVAKPVPKPVPPRPVLRRIR